MKHKIFVLKELIKNCMRCMAEVSFKISQVKLFYIIKLEIEGRIVEVEGKQDELFKSESTDSAC